MMLLKRPHAPLVRHKLVQHRLVRHRLVRHKLVRHKLVHHKLVRHRLVRNRVAGRGLAGKRVRRTIAMARRNPLFAMALSSATMATKTTPLERLRQIAR